MKSTPTSRRPTGVLAVITLVALVALYVLGARPATPVRLQTRVVTPLGTRGTPVGTVRRQRDRDGGVGGDCGSVLTEDSGHCICYPGYGCVGDGCVVVGNSSAGSALHGFNPTTCPGCSCEKMQSADVQPFETGVLVAAVSAAANPELAASRKTSPEAAASGPQQQARHAYKPRSPFPDPSKATGVVVTMVTHNHMNELTPAWWQKAETHLLAPRGGSKLPFLLFLDWELNPDEFVWRARLPWTRVGSTNDFVSDAGTVIHTRQIAVNFPEWLARNMSLMTEPEWLTCYGPKNRFEINYQRYTQSKANQVLHSDALDGYDFMLWIDTDLQFLNDIPVHNIFADLAERGCKLSFSELVLDYGCDHQVSRALQEYGESIGLAPVGWSNRWCHASDNADVIHPWTGFFGVWLGMFRSEQNLELARWMYEWHPAGQADMAPGGNFMHRWSDQAVWFRQLCMWDAGPSHEFLSHLAHGDQHTPHQPNGSENGGVCNRFSNWQEPHDSTEPAAILIHMPHLVEPRSAKEWVLHLKPS